MLTEYLQKGLFTLSNILMGVTRSPKCFLYPRYLFETGHNVIYLESFDDHLGGCYSECLDFSGNFIFHGIVFASIGVISYDAAAEKQQK